MATYPRVDPTRGDATRQRPEAEPPPGGVRHCAAFVGVPPRDQAFVGQHRSPCLVIGRGCSRGATSLLQKSPQRSRWSTLRFDTAPERAVSLSGGRISAVSRAFGYRYGRSREPPDFCNRLLRPVRPFKCDHSPPGKGYGLGRLTMACACVHPLPVGDLARALSDALATQRAQLAKVLDLEYNQALTASTPLLSMFGIDGCPQSRRAYHRASGAGCQGEQRSRRAPGKRRCHAPPQPRTGGSDRSLG